MSSFSFPKTRRLTHRLEYERVKRNGMTQRGKLLMLNAMPVENSGLWRAGFVTSSRLGGAVIRNRVRRRLREIVRRHQHELRQGVWFVLSFTSISARFRRCSLCFAVLTAAADLPRPVRDIFWKRWRRMAFGTEAGWG
jgi:ribonuclease P protein component